jgi:hypothetical protein
VRYCQGGECSAGSAWPRPGMPPRLTVSGPGPAGGPGLVSVTVPVLRQAARAMRLRVKDQRSVVTARAYSRAAWACCSQASCCGSASRGEEECPAAGRRGYPSPYRQIFIYAHMGRKKNNSDHIDSPRFCSPFRPKTAGWFHKRNPAEKVVNWDTFGKFNILYPRF